jgi:hypothetical protein
MVASLVLGCVYGFIAIRNNMAETRNNEIYTTKAMQQYREFNKYDNKLVYGEDIIEAVRNYYNKDVRIYVPKVTSTGSEYYVEKSLTNLSSITSLDYLQTIFKPEHPYQAYLIYDIYDKEDIIELGIPKYGTKITSEVTCILFVED